MTTRYAPRRHMDFHRWAAVFTGRLARDPESASMDRAVADELLADFQEYHALYERAYSKATRTPFVVQAMNEARKTLETKCRAWAQRIKRDPGVADDVKRTLHLDRGRRRKTAPPPPGAPNISLKSMNSGRHVLRWSWYPGGWTGGLSSRLPRGASGVQLFAAVTEGGEFEWSKMEYLGTFTKQPMKVDWQPDVAGMVVVYAARWVSRKGEEGLWSDPLAVQVAFAGAALAQVDRAQQVAGMQQLRRAA